MIDKQFELCDRFDMDAIASSTIVTAASLSASINEYDFGGANHQNALSSIRFSAEISSDSSAALAGDTIQIILQDAADSSGSSGTYSSILYSFIWPASSATPAGQILLDVGLPLDLKQWFRASIKPGGAISSTSYLSMYLYTLR